ncbi:MAG TPA: S8 family peptidase [Hymenobacter sp.]|uniref:S8 family peptidase n=1 Tax=Hymenobacter sp. TaxID=1898978 RepID=UPI002D7E49BD|nr:S8 family peptidase [Hymenobacter sp.]HET9504608.1 S8 family peptidase [Hymenobacter sp.]
MLSSVISLRAMRRAALGGTFFITALGAQAQAQLTPAQRWQHLDQQADGVPGISADRAYRELLAGRTPTPVLVAVIDSGIDSVHTDLKSILWRNAREIAGNGKDDDKNGYADDVRGWSFLGGKDGRNVNTETLEQTRIYAQGRTRYEGKKREDFSKKEQGSFDLYETAKAGHLKARAEAEATGQRLQKLLADLSQTAETLRQGGGGAALDSAALRTAAQAQPAVPGATQLYALVHRQNVAGAEPLLARLRTAVESSKHKLETQLNPDFNARAVVGDNPNNLKQRDYGNADSQGPDAGHGTHCAGIIGAVRTNGVGMEGVADAVRIMSVRAVPDGDERDKDVANAIRYAVDNGAQIISMSFGKDYSPQKAAVDEAMRYADKKGVLLVHAAGNDSRDLDATPNNFPSNVYLDGQPIPNLITVGASSRFNTADLAAGFSNYGPQHVDVFAPGVAIYSTVPGGGYDLKSGTSMACPVVAGMAAVLKAYYPTLTAAQLKACILQSAVVNHTQVRKPGTKTLVDFATLSRTGGIANLFGAVQQAQQVAGK